MFIGQDAIPGTVTPIWFKPIRTGQFEIICGQLCGLGHSAMRAVMMVDSPEDYAAWLKENAPAAPATATNPAAPVAPAPEPAQPSTKGAVAIPAASIAPASAAPSAPPTN